MPNRGFHLSLAFLDRLLSYLRGTGWAIVTIEEALDRAASGGKPDRFVNFSVDDCYRDTWEHVVPLFRRHGAPVTLFVTTGIPDGTMLLWQAGLETLLRERDRVLLDDSWIELPTSEARRRAFAKISAAWDGRDADAQFRRFCRDNGADPEGLRRQHAVTWDMLDTLRDDPHVEVGAHSVSHPRISARSRQEALAELAGSRQRLRERLGLDVRHFAFPYGRRGDCGPRDFALAREAGFASAATTRKGLVTRGQDPFRLPRNTLNGADQNMAAMEAHLSGLTGAAATLLRRV